MMRRTFLHTFAGVLLLGICSLGGATTAPVSVGVDDLIHQLGSDSAQDRDSAQKQLVDLGQKAAGALKKAADESDDPEIRSRAAAALAQMKDLDSNGASLITLHLKDAPVDDVLTAIGTQSHAMFQPFVIAGARGRSNATVTLDADHKPFWDVMTDLCTQLNVCPVIEPSTKNTIRLFQTNRNWMVQSPHEIVGPFWINVAGIYRTRSIDLMGPPLTDDQFSVRLSLLPEPKLAVTQISDFVVKEATDDAGHSLILKGLQHPRVLRSARQVNHTLETHLSYPDQPGKTIKILRGEITAMLAEDMQQFQEDDVLGTPTFINPLTGCKVQAGVTRQGTEMFRVTIQCTREGMDDDQWAGMMNRPGDVTLEDADGQALTGFQMGVAIGMGTNNSSFTSTALFSRNSIGAPGNRQSMKTGDPKRMTWNVATTVKPVVIPVTFNDLPMP